MPIPQTLLELKQLEKAFGGLRVFNGISLKINDGDVLGVIGPNGAGKTTLINVISGVLAPSDGQIFLSEVDVTGYTIERLSQLGMTRSFQHTTTFGDLTIKQNLMRARHFRRKTVAAEVDECVDSLLGKFQFSKYLDSQAEDLPYGVQKLLGLLMALATGPKVLLLDEPAAGLERSERSFVDIFVNTCRSELGIGLLIVEHDMELIKRLCDEILVLDGGSIIASGAPEKVLVDPKVVKAYLGEAEEA